ALCEVRCTGLRGRSGPEQFIGTAVSFGATLCPGEAAAVRHLARGRPGGPAMQELYFCSVSKIARRIRNRDVSATEVVQMHLARIDAVDPSLNAAVTRCDELALDRAKKA